MEVEARLAPKARIPATARDEPTKAEPAADLETNSVKCPNCGGTEFDEDGDCAVCFEPGVIPVRRSLRID
jgi:hypothetical protein